MPGPKEHSATPRRHQQRSPTESDAPDTDSATPLPSRPHNCLVICLVSAPEITRVENLERLSCLTKLNLSGNRLGREPDSLLGLAQLTCLRELDLSDNGM